jgi:hypothetical protein
VTVVGRFVGPTPLAWSVQSHAICLPGIVKIPV